MENETTNEQVLNRLNELEAKVDATFRSSEKTRKYFLFIIWASVIAFVLPLIGLMFAIPSFMTNYVDPMNSLLK